MLEIVRKKSVYLLMSGRNTMTQKSIRSFFKPINVTNNSEKNFEDELKIKKLKSSPASGKENNEGEFECENMETVLSPDQKTRMVKNRKMSEKNFEDELKIKKLKSSPASGKENNEGEFECENMETVLSPDQKTRMVKNRKMAELKLQCSKTPALHDSIGLGWFTALKTEFNQPYFMKLSEFLKTERHRCTVYPPEHHVFSWTQYCDVKDIKVVILGQDPYHGVGQAHGLCFSVQKGIPPPPSLVNMYKELENDIPGFKHPGHGYLVGWAKQGVLLLNACLTVRANNANSHKDQGWEQFTDAVIRTISDCNKGVIFLLWGSYAQKKAAIVDKKKHSLLNAAHPSPLSAHRGFFGCKHFSKCNELLKKDGRTPIDWTDLNID